jgi:hypothetical protein
VDELQARLRAFDWRFLLRGRETPRALDLREGAGDGLDLVARPAADGEADLALLGFPTAAALGRARAALGPGGEVACLWRKPRLRGASKARKLLAAAGFEEVRLHWGDPTASGRETLWLPLEDAAVVDAELARRPPHSRGDALRRRLRRVAARAGDVAPLLAVGRVPGGGAADDVDRALSPASVVLLAGGSEIGSKIVALPVPAGGGAPTAIVKFARTEGADAALDMEARLLRRLGEELPDLGGVPKVLGVGTRMGRRAVAQSAVPGAPLDRGLDAGNFATVSDQVTGWLEGLAIAGPAVDVGEVVRARLDRFATRVDPLLGEPLAPRLRALVRGLAPLPVVWEHRDFGPWNVHADGGEIAVIDWEDADRRGLAGLDLHYFLLTAGLLVEGALGATGAPLEAERRRLLDPSDPRGAVVAACTEHYREALGIAPADLGRLRLLCWASQLVILERQIEAEADRDAAELRGSHLAALLKLELEEAESIPDAR